MRVGSIEKTAGRTAATRAPARGFDIEPEGRCSAGGGRFRRYTKVITVTWWASIYWLGNVTLFKFATAKNK